MVANGAGRVANGAEGNAIKTAGQVQRQPLIDATVEQKQAAAQASLARAAAAGNSGQAAFNAAVQDLISQGMLPADAYAMAKNYTPRNQQAQDRLDLTSQRMQQQQDQFNTRLNADQTYRTHRAGQGNTLAGARAIAHAIPNTAKSLRFAGGGIAGDVPMVPIRISSGEFVVHPGHVAESATATPRLGLTRWIRWSPIFGSGRHSR